MRLAIVGKKCMEASRMDALITEDVTEIVVFGTKGISSIAKKYALSHNIKFTEFLPERKKLFGKINTEQNDLFVKYSDKIMEFGNNRSKDIKYIINHFRKAGKQCIFVISGELAE